MTSCAQSSALLCVLGLAACVPPKTEPGSEGPGELTDGVSSQTDPTEAPPTPTSGGDTTSTGGDVTDTFDTTDSTGVFESSTTAQPEDPDHPLDPECSAEAIEGFDLEAAQAAKHKLDLASLEQVSCPMQQEPVCGAGPIPGLKSALVIRNDQLPAPREFALPNTRWLLWSNRELGCDDPFGAPLCAGEWRITWAVDLPEWCTSLRRGERDFFGFLFREMFLFEFGDAACQTHTGTIKADDLDGSHDVVLQFPAGTLPPEAPQPARFCSKCQIPGVDTPVVGDFVADICP